MKKKYLFLLASFILLTCVTVISCKKTTKDETENIVLTSPTSKFSIGNSIQKLKTDLKPHVLSKYKNTNSFTITNVKYYEVNKFTFAFLTFVTDEGNSGNIGLTNAPLDEISTDKKTVDLTNLPNQLSKATLNWTNTDGVTYTFTCDNNVCCKFELYMSGSSLQSFSCGCDGEMGMDGNCKIKYEGKKNSLTIE